ncbi:MAG: hypothetical protein KF802_00535 [Bdellovibrionaceae bacterium]|nr:hypothetical protein [Pseudobdellovibrionaceae bacterium]
MKNIILATLFFALPATSMAAYEPFKMECVVSRTGQNSENLKEITFVADPDFASNEYVSKFGGGKVKQGEYQDTFIYGYTDAPAGAHAVMTKLKIDGSQVFSVTEFVVNPGNFVGYKINSRNGELGKALYILGTVIKCLN